MKTPTWVLILSFTGFLFLNSNVRGHNKRLVSVKIVWIDLDTETFRAINCDEFKFSSEDTMSKIFNGELYLAKFNQLARFFKKECDYKLIDVRGVIEFIYQENKTEYCFDRFGHFYKDGVISQNKKLMDFIVKNLYSKKYVP